MRLGLLIGCTIACAALGCQPRFTVSREEAASAVLVLPPIGPAFAWYQGQFESLTPVYPALAGKIADRMQAKGLRVLASPGWVNAGSETHDLTPTRLPRLLAVLDGERLPGEQVGQADTAGESLRSLALRPLDSGDGPWNQKELATILKISSAMLAKEDAGLAFFCRLEVKGFTGLGPRHDNDSWLVAQMAMKYRSRGWIDEGVGPTPRVSLDLAAAAPDGIRFQARVTQSAQRASSGRPDAVSAVTAAAEAALAQAIP